MQRISESLNRYASGQVHGGCFVMCAWVAEQAGRRLNTMPFLLSQCVRCWYRNVVVKLLHLYNSCNLQHIFTMSKARCQYGKPGVSYIILMKKKASEKMQNYLLSGFDSFSYTTIEKFVDYHTVLKSHTRLSRTSFIAQQ